MIIFNQTEYAGKIKIKVDNLIGYKYTIKEQLNGFQIYH